MESEFICISKKKKIIKKDKIEIIQNSILSNSYVAPFIINYGSYNLTYNTVNHFIYATMINLADPNYAYQFTINSESEISKISEKYLLNQHMIFLDEDKYQQWNLIKRNIKFIGILEKFRQNIECKNIFLQTYGSKLFFKNCELEDMQLIREIIYIENLGYEFIGKSNSDFELESNFNNVELSKLDYYGFPSKINTNLTLKSGIKLGKKYLFYR